MSEWTPIKETRRTVPLAVILKEKGLLSCPSAHRAPVVLADHPEPYYKLDQPVYDWGQAIILLVISHQIIRFQSVDSFRVFSDK